MDHERDDASVEAAPDRTGVSEQAGLLEPPD